MTARRSAVALAALLGLTSVPGPPTHESPSPGSWTVLGSRGSAAPAAHEPGSVSVSVSDAGFTPSVQAVVQGDTVRWSFDGERTHTVTDASGMSLFDSGDKPPGARYSFRFLAAGSYPYRCKRHPDVMTGDVLVPLVVSPKRGRTDARFTVVRSAAPAPTGYVFDVEVKRPHGNDFVAWKMGQTAESTFFVPDDGAGNYVFRSRLRKLSSGRASPYSPPFTIRVVDNQTPEAVADTVPISGDEPVRIDVLANDTDPDADGLTITAVTQGSYGTTRNNSGASVTYTPGAVFPGRDEFTYTVTDGREGYDTASVIITEMADAGPQTLLAYTNATTRDILLYDWSTRSPVPLRGLNTTGYEGNASISGGQGRFVAFGRPGVAVYDRLASSLVPLPGIANVGCGGDPSISSDGRLIAFESACGFSSDTATTYRRYGSYDIALYDRSTSSLVDLPGLNTDGLEADPSLSGDGRFIAFTSNRSGSPDIHLYDRSRSSIVSLPGLNRATSKEGWASLSENGRWLAFHSDRSGSFRVYLYDRSESSLVPLPGIDPPLAGGWHGDPSISADGRFIAFSSKGPGEDRDVFLYNRNKRSLVLLPGLNTPTTELHPAIR